MTYLLLPELRTLTPHPTHPTSTRPPTLKKRQKADAASPGSGHPDLLLACSSHTNQDGALPPPPGIPGRLVLLSSHKTRHLTRQGGHHNPARPLRAEQVPVALGTRKAVGKPWKELVSGRTKTTHRSHAEGEEQNITRLAQVIWTILPNFPPQWNAW